MQSNENTFTLLVNKSGKKQNDNAFINLKLWIFILTSKTTKISRSSKRYQ